MKIKSVELMRSIRDKMSNEIQGMSWLEEREYLMKHSSSLADFLKEMPNKSIKRDAKQRGGSSKSVPRIMSGGIS